MQIPHFVNVFDATVAVENVTKLAREGGFCERVVGGVRANQLEFGDQPASAAGTKILFGGAIQFEIEEMKAFRRNHVAEKSFEDEAVDDLNLGRHGHALEHEYGPVGKGLMLAGWGPCGDEDGDGDANHCHREDDCGGEQNSEEALFHKREVMRNRRLQAGL